MPHVQFLTACMVVASLVSAAPPISFEHRSISTEVTSLQRVATTGPQAPAGLALVQYDGPMDRARSDALRRAGVVRIAYVPHDAYLVAAPYVSLAQLAGLPGVRWVGPHLPEYKYHPALVPAGTTPVPITIGFVPQMGQPFPADLDVLAKWHEPKTDWWTLRVAPDRIAALAALDAVFAVEPVAEAALDGERAAQIVAGAFRSGDASPNSAYYRALLEELGVDGEGVVVQVQDDGLEQGDPSNRPGTAHPDLLGRIAGIDNWTGDRLGDSARGHGSLNAGIIAGTAATGVRDGQGFLLGQGMAPGARIYATKLFSNDGLFSTGGLSMGEIVQRACRAGARISNNSWGTALFGFYTAQSREFDQLTRDADPDTPGEQSLLFVFSAGNAGPYPATVGAPRTAKNVLVVGASENSDADGTDGCGKPPRQADHLGDLAPFSSRGPTSDGRFGPHLVAPGTHIQGPASTSGAYDGRGVCDKYWPLGQSEYARSSGTSHSAPLVSGAAALFHQFARQRFDVWPSAALTRAALVAACDDMAGGDDGNGGTLGSIPDMAQGWGRLNLSRLLREDVVFHDQDRRFRQTGDTATYLVQPVDPAMPLRMALAWTDAPAVPLANPVLTNDLDLVVTARAGKEIYLGNVFAGGESVPGGERDSRNTLECVFVSQPVGSYEVTVRAARIADDGVPGNGDDLDQDYALWITNAAIVPGFGSIWLDAADYSCAGTVRIHVADADLTATDTLCVQVEAMPSGVTTTVDLEYLSPGLFAGQLSLAALAVAHGDLLTVRYEDTDDGTGQRALHTAQARIDCEAPNVVSLLVYDVLDATATLRWACDEPAQATVGVRLEDETAPDLIFSATSLRYVHELRLAPLASGKRYRVWLDLVDALGNAAIWQEDTRARFETGVLTALRAFDFDSGTQGWTTEHSIGIAGWQPAFVEGRHGLAAWPSTTREGSAALISPWFDLRGPVRPRRLRVRHRYAFERCGSDLIPADGGVVEYRFAGDVVWRLLRPQGRYPGALGITCRNPLGAREAFIGDSGGWLVSEFDLGPLAERQVQLRLVAGWDCGACRETDGWLVDAVALVELHTLGSAARLEFASDVVGCSDTLRFSLIDGGSRGAQTRPATVHNQTDVMNLLLLEREPPSGVFDGAVIVRPDPQPGTLPVADSQWLRVESGAALGFARVDCRPPVVSHVDLAQHAHEFVATLAWVTDEPASSVVYYGTLAGVYSASTTIRDFEIYHRAGLVLRGGRVWYTAIESSDRVGNTGLDTNDGAHYRIDMATPALVVEPSGLDVALAQGEQGQATLRLANRISSGRDITWRTQAYQAVDTGGEARPPQAALDHAGGPDSFGYTWRSSLHPNGPAPEWVEISESGAEIDGLFDESLSREFDIGWGFPFYNEAPSRFRVSSNGFLTFGGFVLSGANTALPNPAGPPWMIAPFWDDLIFARDSRAWYQVFDDRLVVTWAQVPRLFGREPSTFQVVVQRDGRIRFNYQIVGIPTDRMTAGIQDGSGTRGLTVLFNESYVRDGMTIEIVPGVPWLTLLPTQGVVRAGAEEEIGLVLDGRDLAVGDHRAILQLDTTAGSVEVPLHLRVKPIGPLATLELDRPAYRCEDQVVLEVRDRTLAGFTGAVAFLSTQDGPAASVQLFPVTPGGGVFRGAMAIAPQPAPRVLPVRPDDMLLARFPDPDDGSGAFVIATATADVDCRPPRLFGIRVEGVGSTLATIRWESDEPATASVLAGTACGGTTLVAHDTVFATAGRATLRGLLPGEHYSFVLSATDRAGNAVHEDNAGGCFEFITPPRTCTEVARDSLAAPSAFNGVGNVFLAWTDARLAEVVFPITVETAQDLRSVIYEVSPDLRRFAVLNDRMHYGVRAGAQELSTGVLDIPIVAGQRYAAMLYWRFPVTTGWQAPGQNPPIGIGRVVAGAIGSWFDTARPTANNINYRATYCFEPVAHPAGTLAFDRQAYGCHDTVTLVLRDSDLAGTERQVLRVVTNAGDAETFILLESAPDSWNFLGSVPCTPGEPVPGDGLLQVVDEVSLLAQYDDRDDGTGESRQIEAIATIDCAVPEIFDVAVASVGWSTAQITWRTVRPASSVVRYGERCDRLPYTVSDTAQVQEHAVNLSGLAPGRSVAFVVEATGTSGLGAREDNGGRCYTLTTHDVRRILAWTRFATTTGTQTLAQIVQAVRSVRSDFQLDLWSGAELDPARLNEYAVLLIVPQDRARPDELLAAGQVLASVFHGFLADGGVVVACDEHRSTWPLLAGAGLVQVERVRNVSRETVRAPDVEDPLLPGVGGTHYTSPDSAAFLIAGGTTVLADVQGLAHVWRRTVGLGELVLIGHNYAVVSPAMSQLLANAIFRFPVVPPPALTVEPAVLPCRGQAEVTLQLPPQRTVSARVVARASTGDSEEILLSAHTRVPGRYRGVLTVAADNFLPGDGVLAVEHARPVDFSFEDLHRQAAADCVAPGIANVRLVAIENGRILQGTWDTDEPSVAWIEYGSACGVFEASAASVFGVSHEASFAVPAGERVWARIVAVDVAGNRAVHDNQGACYAVDLPRAERVLLFGGYADRRPGREWGTTRTVLLESCPEVVIVDSTDPGRIPDLLRSVDALVIPEQALITAATAQVLAEQWRGALSAFVNNGGVMVVCDPAGTLHPLLSVAGLPAPARRGGATRRRLFARAEDPLATGLPESTVAPDESGVFGVPGGTLADISDAACVFWAARGAGVVVAIGHDFFAPNAALATVLANAIRYLPQPAPEVATLVLSAPSYGCADTVRITVRDGDRAGDGQVHVSASSQTGDRETVALHELGRSSGVFEALVDLTVGVPADDGILQVAPRDTLHMVYEESAPVRRIEATADIDCRPPIITDVRISDLRPDGGIVRWATHLPARSAVRAGTACGEGTVVEQAAMVTEHAVALVDLEPVTTYLFSVASTDANGQTTIDDNAGACYTFRTTPGRRLLVYTGYADTGAGGELTSTLAALASVTPDFVWTPLVDYTQLEARLRAKDVLLVVDQERALPSVLAAIGAAWESALRRFVEQGGVAIFCDFAGSSWPIANRAGLLRISASQEITGRPLRLTGPADPIAGGVEPTFLAPPNSSMYTTAEGNVVIADASEARAVVIDKPMGDGAVVLLGHDFQSPDVSMRRLLANAVFQLPAPGAATPTPAPMARIYSRVTAGDPRQADSVFVVTLLIEGNTIGPVGSYSFRFVLPESSVRFVSAADAGGLGASPASNQVGNEIHFSAFNVTSRLQNGPLCRLTFRTLPNPASPFSLLFVDLGPTPLVTVNLLPILHTIDNRETTNLGQVPARSSLLRLTGQSRP